MGAGKVRRLVPGAVVASLPAFVSSPKVYVVARRHQCPILSAAVQGHVAKSCMRVFGDNGVYVDCIVAPLLVTFRPWAASLALLLLSPAAILCGCPTPTWLSVEWQQRMESACRIDADAFKSNHPVLACLQALPSGKLETPLCIAQVYLAAKAKYMRQIESADEEPDASPVLQASLSLHKVRCPCCTVSGPPPCCPALLLWVAAPPCSSPADKFTGC